MVHHGTPYNYGVWSTLGNLSNRWTTVDYPWKIWYRDPLQPQAVDPDRSYKRQSIDTTGRTDTDSMCSVWYLKKNVYEVEHRVILTGRVYLTLRQIRNFCPENCRYTKAVLSPCSNCRANLRFWASFTNPQRSPYSLRFVTPAHGVDPSQDLEFVLLASVTVAKYWALGEN